jgi:D-sedoheptulose 7-phosphate isomerase
MIERDLIDKVFENHSNILSKTLVKHSKNIASTANLVAECFNNSGKLIFFGNGGSAAEAQHIAAEYVGRFLLERKSLPAVAFTTDTSILTAIANDFGYDNIFQRQVESFVNKDDVVFAISTSGNSENVINGVLAARTKGAKIIALTGEDGGELRQYADILIDIPSTDTPRIQEMHTLINHTICNIVESKIVNPKVFG